MLSFCRTHRVELLVVRCDSSDTQTVHAIEEVGGRLMDTLVYFSRGLEGSSSNSPAADTVVRSGCARDAEAVRDLAASAFKGYAGHYHADPRLDPTKADEAYSDWAYRSCVSRSSEGGPDEVLVAESGTSLVGFLSLRRDDSDDVEIILNAVARSSQGQGIYARLLAAAVDWATERGASRILVSTQLVNLGAQKAWLRAGFEPLRSLYTFHVWLDPR